MNYSFNNPFLQYLVKKESKSGSLLYSLSLALSIGRAFAATARGAEIIIVCNLVNRLNSRHSIRILSTALHQHWLLEKGSRTMECSLIIFDSGMSLLQELLKRGPTTAVVCIFNGKMGLLILRVADG